MKAAVCAWVRNEEGDIAEWIAFHLAVGFETCIILDNASTDRTVRAARACMHRDTVRVNRCASNDQMRAYEDCLSKHGRDFDWIAFIDSDEFLVPKGDGLRAFLSAHAESAAIGINWAIYGTSGLVDKPSGLIVESLLNRSHPQFDPNRHVKSIVRPSRVVSCASPHVFVVDGSYVDAEGAPFEWDNPLGVRRGVPSYSNCQVNHYFLRSRWHWDAKLRRGYRGGLARRPVADFDAYDRNEVFDDCALRFLPETKRRLSKFRPAVAGPRAQMAALLKPFR